MRKGSQDLYESAEDLYKNVSKGERDAWCNHPLTDAMIKTLYGDLSGHFEGWSNGEFTGESSDETIQKNSRALGSVSAIELLLSWLEDLKSGDLYD